MVRRRLSPHVYIADHTLPGGRRGDPPLCRCGLPRRHERHDVPAQDPGQAAYEARRLGEREEQYQ